MTIYYINNLLILIYGYIFRKNRLVLLTITGIQLIIIAGIRHSSVGVDITGYLNVFEYIANANWDSVLLLRYEPGYLFINKILAYVTGDSQVFLGIMAALTIFPILVIVYKYSKMPALSMFLYCSFGFYAFSLSGIRSAIATAYVFLSYSFIIERKPIKFLLLVLTACLFHISASVCLLLYPLINQKLNIVYLIFILITSLLLWIIKLPFIQFIVNIVKPEYSEMIIESNSINFMLILIIIFIGCYLVLKNLAKHNRLINIMLNIMLLSIFSQMFATVSNNAVRITNFFFIISVLLIPEVIYRLKSKETHLFILIIAIVISTAFFEITTVGSNLQVDEYRFFWE